MSFLAPFDSSGDDCGSSLMASGAIAQSSFPKSMFSSPSLSLALTNVDGLGAGEMVAVDGGFGVNVRRRSKEEEAAESRSGSDNMDGGSGEEMEGESNGRKKKKKRYHRHSAEQIQELEAMFKECPHPDEKQRLELSRRLSLETKQVKFWFQNRRTQMKTQLERHENTLLRQENEKLRTENMAIREAMRNPICSNCGGPAIIGEITIEEQELRIENARLKDELDRVCALAGKFLGRVAVPVSPPLASSSCLEEYGGGMMMMERCVYLEMGLAAMDEVMKMANVEEPLWVGEKLNEEEYLRMFSGSCFGIKPINGFVSEASRQTALVFLNTSSLVDTLMDPERWVEMFPNVVATASTTDIISGGMGGTRNGALQLMHAELQILSPMVPVRQLSFLRFCKQHAEGVWAVADVSIDPVTDTSSSPPCRRLPSGCLIHDMPNGYSKVTWVEHHEYDERYIHELYRPHIRSGYGFGARRWIATLQRQSECLAVLSSPLDHSVISANGRRSLVKLAQRMTASFCAGVCASTVYKWNKLNARNNNVGEDVRVMTRKSVEDPGEPPGTVLSAATSVWVSAEAERVFEFLRDERLRSEWDILSNGGPMQEMLHIPKSQHHHHPNAVSLLRATSLNPNQSSMLILQETCTDASGRLVVYAPVDIPAMQVVMNGGDSAYVALLPSGFAVLPASEDGGGGGGSLLTVGFQILVNSSPTDRLTVESVETVNNLISCTVQKIKTALRCHEPST